jgi:hypothetical protein
LLADGTVIDTAGTATASFSVEPAAYFVAIRHRNHAAVHSLNTIDLSSGSGTWDIRTDDSNVLVDVPIAGTLGLKDLGTGNYVIYGANSNATDNSINIGDLGDWLAINTLSNLYDVGDWNLDGVGNINDLNIWIANNGLTIAFP